MKTIPRAKSSKRAVVILPYRGNRVLMQLRDEKTWIDFPGHWGCFSGGIEKMETPLESARREIFEEIGCRMDDFIYLGRNSLFTTQALVLYAFACPLRRSASQIRLMEGMDCDLFGLEEIRKGVLFSKKMKSSYPVVPVPVVATLIRKLFARIGMQDE